MSTKRILTPTAIKEMMIFWHQKEIADLTGKSRSTVQSIIKKWKETGCVENQWCKERPSTFSTCDANRLKRIVKANVGASTDHIFKTFLAENPTKFSKLTIYIIYIQIYKEYPSICQYKHIAAAVGLTDRYLRPIPC